MGDIILKVVFNGSSYSYGNSSTSNYGSGTGSTSSNYSSSTYNSNSYSNGWNNTAKIFELSEQ